MASRLETNFKRLLGRCEAMVAGDSGKAQGQDWRLEQYLITLQEQLSMLEKTPGSSKPSSEALSAYGMKLSVLKGLMEARRQAGSSSSVSATEHSVNSALLKLNHDAVSQASRQAHIKANNRHVQDMRDELLSGRDSVATSADSALVGGLRQRSNASSSADRQAESLEETLKGHRQRQEEIAEDMVELARQIKETQRVAQLTITGDSEVLLQSANKAETATDRLRTETEGIQRQTRKACSCWTWLMIVIVAIIFLVMVVFIRLFPK